MLLLFWRLLFLIGCLLSASSAEFSAASIVSIVDDKPMDPLPGRICGIGDMNKDGNADVIVQQRLDISGAAINRLAIFLQSETGEFRNATQTIELTPGKEDVFCNVGDFNGDACPDLLVVQQIAEELDIIDKLKAVFTTKTPPKYQAKVYLNERDNKFKEILLCDKSTDAAKDQENEAECVANKFLDHPILLDVNGDGITDILGFEAKANPDGGGAGSDDASSLFCRAGQFHEDQLHDFAFKPCETHFPGQKQPRQFHRGFMPIIFTDLDGDLGAELAFVDSDGEANSSAGRKKRLVVWKLKDVIDADNFHWEQDDALTIDLPNSERRLGSPLVADFDSDGAQEILVPVCDTDSCESVSTLWCYKFGGDLASNRAQWQTVAVDLGKSIIQPEIDGDTVVLFRIGDFSQNGYPDLIATMGQPGGVKIPTIVENIVDPTSNLTRKFAISQKPQRVIKDLQNAQLSAFFDLKEDGNLDILYEFLAENGQPMVNFVKCDDKGDTTFLKVQIFTGDHCGQCCAADKETSRTVKIGSGIAWQGACVRIQMTDPNGLIEQGVRLSHQCQLPQSGHRLLHSPFVLFGLSRSPNFVDIVYMGAPRPVSAGRWQQDFIRQIVPNSRVIVIPPAFDDRNGGWTSRLYVTPSRLIILSFLVMVCMCVILLILIGVLHFREKHEDKKERQAQTHRFHFDAM